jgi:hypothetical protein
MNLFIFLKFFAVSNCKGICEKNMSYILEFIYGTKLTELHYE